MKITQYGEQTVKYIIEAQDEKKPSEIIAIAMQLSRAGVKKVVIQNGQVCVHCGEHDAQQLKYAFAAQSISMSDGSCEL